MHANISLKMEKSISVLMILIMTTGMVSGDSVTPDKEEYTPTEGSSVTLSCAYETSSNFIYLYWYRHYSNQAPQFLLYKGARSYGSEHISDKRHKSTTSWTSTELVITSLTLADTALYYCALRDTGLGWATLDTLTFGKAINLIVQPNGIPAHPTLSILTPLHKRGDDDQPEVCLATGFFPRKENMNLILENNDTSQLSTTKAALSSTHTYFFAGFSKNNIKSCEMDGIVKKRVDDKADFTDVTNYNTTDTTASVICKDEPLNNATATNYTDYTKMNFTSLVVYGLRVLFAKAVAFNVLFTVKALVF